MTDTIGCRDVHNSPMNQGRTVNTIDDDDVSRRRLEGGTLGGNGGESRLDSSVVPSLPLDVAMG